MLIFRLIRPATYCLCLAVAQVASGQTVAFPGAQGFGRFATGGRNGTVYRVTNLADSGAGSFRNAVSQPNRIIVFETNGTITLQSPVSCSDNLTIAGQTAPGGIAIIGHEVSFSVLTNEIVRYLRIRPGSAASSTEDGINMGDGTNMIFDHISIEFAPYNNIDAHGNYTGGNQITVQNSILADPITQQFNAHTEALNNTFSWCYDIFSSGHDRNPLAKVNTVFVNNVVYNFQAGYTCANTSGNFSHDIVNNYFITGPSTTSASDDFFQVDANQSVYAAGNLLDSANSGTLNGSSTAPGGVIVLNSPWSTVTTEIPTFSTTTAYRYDVSFSGAQPRDQVDQLIYNDVTSLGTSGTLWTSQASTGLGNSGYGVIAPESFPGDSDGDGMPDYWKAAVGLSLTSGGDAMTIASDGYANIEHYLNWLAAPNAITVTDAPVNVDLWQFTSGFTNASPVYTVSNPTNGTVVLNNAHIARFTPTANFMGLGSFNFSVADSDGSGMTDTVTICVSPIVVTQSVTVVTPPPPSPAIFVALRTTTTGPGITTISEPTGYNYSAAAPAAGTTWNTIDLKGRVGTNSTTGAVSNLYSGLALESSSGTVLTQTLSVAYTSVVSTGTRTQPSTASGENTIQSGGVMENAWRDYYNASGNYFTFTISGLTPLNLYDLYLEGGTTTSGQGEGATLASGNALAYFPTNAVTTNTTENVNASYGSLFSTNFADGYELMPQGTTWNVLHGQADGAGHFSFIFNGPGSSAYLNGFQLVPVMLPDFIGSSQTGGGDFQLLYMGTAGRTYRLWASTNLLSWPVTNAWRYVTTGTFSGNTDSFQESQSPNYPEQFYQMTMP
jgi:Bacterial Ig domain